MDNINLIMVVIFALLLCGLIMCLAFLLGWWWPNSNDFGNTAIEGKVTIKGIYTSIGEKLACYPNATLTPSNTYVAYYLVSKQIDDSDFYNVNPPTIVSVNLFDNENKFVGAEITVPVQDNKKDVTLNLWKFITTKDQNAPVTFNDAKWTKVASTKNINNDPAIKSLTLTDNSVSVTSAKATTIQTSKYNLNIPCSLTGVSTDLKAYSNDNTVIW